MKIIFIILVILCLVTSYIAYRPPAVNQDEIQDLSGQIIGKADANLEEVARLRVVTWQSSDESAVAFEVKHGKDGWEIPSHHNYPADAGSQVGKTAGSVMNLAYGRKIDVLATDYAKVSVRDPLSADGGNGIGIRVSLWNKEGSAIVDLIIGDEVEGETGHRYVREVSSEDVYTARLDFQFSSDFTDWVDRSVIEVNRTDISTVLLDRYSIDEQKRSIAERNQRVLMFSNDKWETIEPDGMQLKESAVDDLVSAAVGMNLVGVRPFGAKDPAVLQRHGFFVDNQGALFGNEGSVALTQNDGLMYFIFLGEIATGDGLALSAGSEEKVETQEGDYRYVAIFVRYNDKEDSKLADALARNAQYEKDIAAWNKRHEERDGKENVNDPKPVEPTQNLEQMKKERKEFAQRLNKKYNKYFYVIDEESFRGLTPIDDSLFEAKPLPIDPTDAVGGANPATPAPQ